MPKNPDEWEVIRLFAEILGQPSKGYSKIGDDVAQAPLGKGNLILKCDMLVGHTDVPRGMSYRQAARKAVVASVSDFAAKTVTPDATMVSIGLPRGTSLKGVKDLALGLKDACNEFNLRFLGGDTNEARDLILDCMMVGYAERIVGRGGAAPGNLVAVSGPFGYTGAGLRILSGGCRASPRFKARAVQSVLHPEPRLSLGIALGSKGILSSSIDSSDGLAISLYGLAEASSVRLMVDRAPAGEGVDEFAGVNGLNSDELVFHSGEEYELVFTIPKDSFQEALRISSSLGTKIMTIGRVEKGAPEVRVKKGRTWHRLDKKGWTHLT